MCRPSFGISFETSIRPSQDGDVRAVIRLIVLDTVERQTRGMDTQNWCGSTAFHVESMDELRALRLQLDRMFEESERLTVNGRVTFA
jgi:hypothetical protein